MHKNLYNIVRDRVVSGYKMQSDVSTVVGGPANILRIVQTLIHSYIFSGMVHLGDWKLLNFLFRKKILSSPQKFTSKNEKKRS